ncbi:hypothetical protein BD770DRAFT_432867 [Pilaira anomala]|nr:hypothetical protein BD770DRAFT_432867 [Pilaira anomala]
MKDKVLDKNSSMSTLKDATDYIDPIQELVDENTNSTEPLVYTVKQSMPSTSPAQTMSTMPITEVPLTDLLKSTQKSNVEDNQDDEDIIPSDSTGHNYDSNQLLSPIEEDQEFFFQPSIVESDEPSNPVFTDVKKCVQSRTQVLEGGNVRLKTADNLDVPDKTIPARTGPVFPELDMDIPVDLEIRLKKNRTQKRKFVPQIKNHAKRKRPKQ